jgi:hypothetical protein
MNTPTGNEVPARLRGAAWFFALCAMSLLSGCAQQFVKVGQTQRVAVTLPCNAHKDTTFTVDGCNVKRVISGPNNDNTVAFNGLPQRRLNVAPSKFVIPAGKTKGSFTFTVNDPKLKCEQLFFIVREKSPGEQKGFTGIYSVVVEAEPLECCLQNQQIKSGVYTPIGTGKK